MDESEIEDKRKWKVKKKKNEELLKWNPNNKEKISQEWLEK